MKWGIFIDVITFHIEKIQGKKDKKDTTKKESGIRFAAYCFGKKYYNEVLGRTVGNYRNDVVHSETILPENAPDKYKDWRVLWDETEALEQNKNRNVKKDCRYMRAIYCAFPIELDLKIQIRMLREYVQGNFVNICMCASTVIHDNGKGNPHAHILLPLRALDKNGNWLDKQKKNYILDENGNKIYDPVKRQYKCGRSIQVNDWDNPKNAEKWRESWARICNRELELHGFDKRVTHLSYERQGSDQIPTIHLGPQVAAMEQRGIRTDYGNYNRNVKVENRKRKRLQKTIPGYAELPQKKQVKKRRRDIYQNRQRPERGFIRTRNE